MRTATIADEQMFAGLTPETQESVRALAFSGFFAIGDLDAVAAYERGFEDAVDDMDFSRPMCPPRDSIVRRLSDKVPV